MNRHLHWWLFQQDVASSMTRYSKSEESKSITWIFNLIVWSFFKQSKATPRRYSERNAHVDIWMVSRGYAEVHLDDLDTRFGWVESLAYVTCIFGTHGLRTVITSTWQDKTGTPFKVCCIRLYRNKKLYAFFLAYIIKKIHCWSPDMITAECCQQSFQSFVFVQQCIKNTSGNIPDILLCFKIQM